MARKRAEFTFDVENTTCEPATVWMWALAPKNCTVPTQAERGVDIGALLAAMLRKPNNSKFYAHNLSHDLNFILCYLGINFKGEYEVSEEILSPLTKSYMSAKIKFKGKTLRFEDTYVKFTAPLSAVMKSYTNFKKTETPLYQYIEDVEYTEANYLYCQTDAVALAVALTKRETIGEGKLTTASDAFAVFRTMGEEKHGTNFHHYISPLSVETDDKLRPAYRGGMTLANPLYIDTVVKDVDVIDVNSMYPHVMYNRLMPYGKPKLVNGEVRPTSLYPLGIQRVYIEWFDIKPECCPFISKTNAFTAVNTYLDQLTQSEKPEEHIFMLTLQELELFKNTYHHGEIKYLDGALFKGTKDLFKSYIDHFWAMKNDDDETIKNNGKLFLNSLYGKLAEGYKKKNFRSYYDEKLCFEEAGETIEPRGYLPAGIFITSYARLYLVESINKIGYSNFVYCDTDSIHYIRRDGDPMPDLHFDKDELGAWDYEDRFKRARYIRAKRYIGERVDPNHKKGALKVACAGIKKPSLAEQILKFEDFYAGKAIKTFEFKNGRTGKYTRDKIITI